nr:DUF5995 family protein [Actinacidiphila yeochonensis]
MTPRRPRTRTAGVGRVAARMRALAADLPPNDGVAVFNRVYLAVTDEVRHRMAAGEFPDGPRAARLTVVFAERYLAAVEGPPAAAPACWRALLRARGRRTAAPLQFALAGITAHVGHDLALAVVDACREAGCPPAGLDADFTEVGAVLAAVEERVREELMPGPDLLERFDAVTHAVGCWSLARARSGAWGAARVLWALRDHPRGFARCATGLDRTTALAVRALLAPAPRHPAPAASAADAAVAGPAEPAPVPSPARS